MTTFDQLFGQPLGTATFLSIILLALVSRYLSARNERLLITIGEVKSQNSAWKAWLLTAFLLISAGTGLLVESYLDSFGYPSDGILLIFLGLGIAYYFMLRVIITFINS